MLGVGLGVKFNGKVESVPYVYPVDEWSTNILYAFSFRKLSSTYLGNSVRVRRSSDNTEQNFGFVGNYTDIDSILAFVGTGPTDQGTIVTWFDQSGNGNNKTQATAVDQPVIVMGGSYNSNMINGRIAAYQPTGSPDRGMTNSFASPPANVSIAFHVWRTEGEALPAVVTGGFYATQQNGNPASPTSNMGSPTYYKNKVSLSSSTRDSLYDAFILQLALCTVQNVDLSPYTSITSKFPGFRGITGLNFEEIVYGTQANPTADIENNIMGYYGIS